MYIGYHLCNLKGSIETISVGYSNWYGPYALSRVTYQCIFGWKYHRCLYQLDMYIDYFPCNLKGNRLKLYDNCIFWYCYGYCLSWCNLKSNSIIWFFFTYWIVLLTYAYIFSFVADTFSRIHCTVNILCTLWKGKKEISVALSSINIHSIWQKKNDFFPQSILNPIK